MLIITVAPTGLTDLRGNAQYLPVTPQEIAEECIKAWEAGAAIAHIHVRDPNTLMQSHSVELYREVIDTIRDKCNMIIQLTTATLGASASQSEERVTHLALRPESASLDVATMTFRDGVFINHPDFVQKLAKIMLEKNVKPEIECFDVGHINLAIRLQEKMSFKEPLRISLVLGVVGGIPATPKNLVHMIECLPRHTRWQLVCMESISHFKMVTLAMALGGDVRVGMEDNIYLAKNILAKSNAELVAKATKTAEEFGLEVATPDEARKLLGLSS